MDHAHVLLESRISQRSDRARSRRFSDWPHRLVLLAGVSAVAGCGDAMSGPVPLDTPGVDAALASIEPRMIEHHIGVLAHDSMEVRAPGTAGYEASARYAEEQLRALGMERLAISGPTMVGRSAEANEAATRLTEKVLPHFY